jgi:hypothetical protein
MRSILDIAPAQLASMGLVMKALLAFRASLPIIAIAFGLLATALWISLLGYGAFQMSRWAIIRTEKAPQVRGAKLPRIVSRQESAHDGKVN